LRMAGKKNIIDFSKCPSFKKMDVIIAFFIAHSDEKITLTN